MKILKAINQAFTIKEGKMKDFIKEFNNNKISDEFLEECRKISKIFERR